MILLDTSVLLEYFRKQKKEETLLFQLFESGDKLFISTITRYEIMIGNSPKQETFWDNVLKSLNVLVFGEKEADRTALIYKELKKKNQGERKVVLITCNVLIFRLSGMQLGGHF